MANEINILVVDDQETTGETLGEIVKDILKGKRCRVVLANGGYAAIKKVKEIPFTIVFLDIKMPDMNGVETLSQIKRISPRTTVVMMTGGAEGELVRASTKKGAYAILYKPFHYHMIMDIVNEVLNVKPSSPDLAIKSKLSREAKVEGGHQASVGSLEREYRRG